MEIGIVGKPNVGKSTFFSAATLAPAQIANYPFTTIEPNKGVAYVRSKCPHVELGVPCNPNNSQCADGTRLIPVEMIDVAGLVPGAHEGRGLGNKFLDDLRQASCLIHVVDASGGTDCEGRTCAAGSHDPLEDVRFLEDEIAFWIRGLLGKDWSRISKQTESEGTKVERILHDKFTGLGFTEGQISAALRKSSLGPRPSAWSEDELLALSRNLQRTCKPLIIAANKCDVSPLGKLGDIEGHVIPTSAELELALRRAAKAGLVSYLPGDSSFNVNDPAKLNAAQKGALDKIAAYLKGAGDTGVQRCIETAVFKMLDLIAVYPVEDENKFTDKKGRVLPDAYLVPRGSSAKDLAFKVHTDLGNNFIRAIDARTKRVVGQDHQLKDGDVVTIVSKR